MEQHFDALGCAGAGKEMMTATAALQVNLDAGPAAGWSERLSLIRTLVPMLVAASSTSPYLGGHTSGWHSMRQGTWQGIDHGRSDPVPRGRADRGVGDLRAERPGDAGRLRRTAPAGDVAGVLRRLAAAAGLRSAGGRRCPTSTTT